MAGKRIETMDLRQLIILKKQGLSNRKIAALLQISRNTVNGDTKVFESLNNDYGHLLALDDLSLKELCAPESEVSADRYEALSSQFEYFAAELKKPGCTVLTLWHEYRQKQPGGYGYTTGQIKSRQTESGTLRKLEHSEEWDGELLPLGNANLRTRSFLVAYTR